jgi:hypothetical protein
MDRRRLACPVRPQKTVDLSGWDLEINPVDRPHALEITHQCLNADRDITGHL